MSTPQKKQQQKSVNVVCLFVVTLWKDFKQKVNNLCFDWCHADQKNEDGEYLSPSTLIYRIKQHQTSICVCVCDSVCLLDWQSWS